MKAIKYIRHEFQEPSEEREASLLSFVYDVPYLSCCGIFPPLQILNGHLQSGGGDGGMGPGAEWKPFTLSDVEYEDLLTQIAMTQPDSLADSARYTDVKLERDTTFDGIQDPIQWMKAVAEKHREAYRKRIKIEGNPST